MRTDKLAVITAEHPIAYQAPQRLWDCGFVLDSEISNTPSGVQFIWRIQRSRRADRRTSRAGAAMIGVWRVNGQGKICIELPEEKPGTGLRIDQVGVLSDPAESGRLSEWFLHYRRAICKSPVGEGPYCFSDLISQFLQPSPHGPVIIPPEGITGDIGLFRIPKGLMSRVVRIMPITQSDANDPDCIGNQQVGLRTLLDVSAHKVHLPLPAFFKPSLQCGSGLGEFARRNSYCIEPQIKRPLPDVSTELL